MDYILLILQILSGLGIVFLAMFKTNYFPKYLEEKAKNTATKEDIKIITEQVESVKTDYAKVIEEIRSNNQLKLAEIEREKNIRKEVYLEAVESITRYLNLISSISNINNNEQELNHQMIKDSGVIAKIQIVGSESTVRAVTSIMSAIGTALFELMLERNTLILRKNDIEAITALYSKSYNEIERYILMMKNSNLEGNKDTHFWKMITEFFEFETNERNNHQEKINTLTTIQTQEQLAFSKKCMSKYFEISRLIPEAILSVRNDLGLLISNEAYLDIYNQNIELGIHVLENFYAKVSNEKSD
ncbi:MAG: hypothetical protein WA099_11280 [Sulfuricurvum sp.]